MKSINKIAAVVGLTLLVASGCASHARIEKAVQASVESPLYNDKTISHEVFYSQLEPGLFNAEKQQELTRLSEATLSVAAAQVLDNFDNTLAKYKPLNTEVVSDSGDLMLRISLIAHDKAGPAYPDHQFLESLGKNLLTLGVGGSDYEIIADFSVTYELYSNNSLVHRKTYQVNERVEHTAGEFEFSKYDTLNKVSQELFDKHIGETLTAFYREAGGKGGSM